MVNSSNLDPFPKFKALDGYHCQTNSFAKIFDYHGAPLSEELLLGLGAGIGFIYWHQKGTVPFLGGRGNSRNFHQDMGSRCGVEIVKKETSSSKKAEKTLITFLERKEPMMLFVDMGFLPYFDFGGDYHFGGHTHVVCGYDGKDKVLVSDMAAKDVGLKKGFVHEMTLEELAIARGSKFKPFPPKHGYFEFDFTAFRPPSANDFYAAIKQTADDILNPPIKNFGIKGIVKAGQEIKKWEKIFDDATFRMSLFNIYLFVSVAGTGDGLFRYMYSRFLTEASIVTANRALADAAKKIKACGDLWVEMSSPLKEALTMENPSSLVDELPDRLNAIAATEIAAFRMLQDLTS